MGGPLKETLKETLKEALEEILEEILKGTSLIGPRYLYTNAGWTVPRHFFGKGAFVDRAPALDRAPARG